MATDRDEYEFIVRFRAEALAAAKQAEEALRGMGGGARETKEELDNATEAMEQAAKAGAALATFLTSAYASFAVVKGALAEFSQFETAMTGIAKVADLAQKDLTLLGDSFEKLAYQAGLPIEDFLKVAEVAGSLGIEGVTNIQAFSSAMVDLGGASNITAEEGANAIARMLNVTKEGIEGARTISSVLVELGNISAATESEIVSRAQEIALATAAFGTNTTEALALGAAMAELGLRAETSGTAVGAIFIAMSTAAVKGGEDLNNFAAAANLTTKEFQSMQRSDPTGLFYKLLEALSDKDQNTIVKTLSDLNVLNADNAKTLIPLITGYERLKTVRKAAYDERDNPQALDRESERAAETLAREFEGLMQGLTNEIRQLGEILAPIAQAMIDVAKAVLDGFNALPEVFQNTILLTGLLGSTFLAASLAVKGLALALGFLLPASVSAAAAGGVTSAAILGVGTAGQVAAGGLAVLRLGVGALFGPIGLAVAAAGALAYALSGDEEEAQDAATTLSEASTAMDMFTEATARATEEQIGLRNGVTEATEALVNQSRRALQESSLKLTEYVTNFMSQAVTDGKFGDTLREEIEGSISGLEGLTAYDLGNDETFVAVAEILADLKEGAIGVDAARDALDKYTAAGKEAIKLASDYRNALASGDESKIKTAAAAMINYADSIGLYGKELDNLRLLASQSNLVPGTLTKAVADLAESIERGGEAGEAIRDILPPALLEILDAGAKAEVQLAANEAALQGNYDLAKLILESGDPFASVTSGAQDAEEAVRGMGLAMQEAYGFYDKFTEFDPKSTDRGSYQRDQIELAEREGILGLIRQVESKGDYNVTLDNGAYTNGPVDLINMTLREVLALQKMMLANPANAARNGDASSAVGAYQIVGTTLGGKGLTGEGGLIAQLGLSLEEKFSVALQDRLALQLLRGRQGQGVAGLRNEWEGLKNVAPSTIEMAMSGTVIPGVDPELERAQNETAQERLRLLEEQTEAQLSLTDAQAESISSKEFELSLIGRSTEAQARMRAEYELLLQAKRDGIDVDMVSAETGKTYREGIEETARAIGKLALAEEKAAKAQENAGKAKAFYNQQQEVFQQGVLDAILEGENLIDVLGGIAKAFARAALEGALFGTGPFGGGGGGLLSGLFGAFTGAITGITSAQGNTFTIGGQGAADLVAFAKGGLPDLSEFSNGKVGKPTLFNMGPDQVGLMGEAGEEAIMPLEGGKVLALLNGREVYLPLERGADGTLGVRLPDQDAPGNDWRDTYTPYKAYALGGVPMGAGEMLDASGVNRSRGAGRMTPSEPGSASGGVAITYSPTYSVQSGGSGGTDKEAADRLTEQLDAHMRAAFSEFMTEQLRNGGMLNPGAKTY